MKRLIVVGFLALTTTLGAAASAQAAPASTALSGLSTSHSGVQLADYKRGRHYRHRNYRRGHWQHHRGYRHNRYRGWHRYHSRPWNWRTRGCVALGPAWVCP
ncbi:MAG: hypothetical protein JSR99_00800 [Proteobacteria bacterium]|nr:hypothetical protein [Pseudomonadota bacterium]